MGVIYVNGGYRKAKLPVDLKDSSVNIGGTNGLDISVEEEGNLVIDTQNIEQLDKVVENEILNIN